jgi:hypothetical protein
VQGPMAMDVAGGFLYVAESVNDRIHKYEITG